MRLTRGQLQRIIREALGDETVMVDPNTHLNAAFTVTVIRYPKIKTVYTVRGTVDESEAIEFVQYGATPDSGVQVEQISEEEIGEMEQPEYDVDLL